MRVTTVYLTCLASCFFGSACERDADEATDAAPPAGAFRFAWHLILTRTSAPSS